MLQRWSSIGKFLGLFCLCFFLAISCDRPNADPGTSPPTSVPHRITLGTTAKVRTLDPADAYEIMTNTLLYNLGDRLYTYGPGSTELQPHLATAMPTVSADGLTYTIPLREGVKFHDGAPFNAEAMAFSLQRLIQNGGSPSALLADLIAEVRASGPFELTLRLHQPFAAFPAMLAFPGACAVSPQAYTLGAGEFSPNTFVGTGPYQLVSYDNDAIKLEAFPDYWGEKPANPGIDLQILSSAANLYNAFQVGTVDVAFQSLDPDQVRNLQMGVQQGKWQGLEGQGNGIHYLSLNVKSPPLDQVEVRRAIASVMNRPLLQERVFQGQVDPLYSLIPASLSAHRPVFQERYGEGDRLEGVQAFLAKGGYSAANPLTLELWYRSNLPSNERAAATLNAWVQQALGGAMVLQLKGVESATAYQNLDKGLYPMVLLDWVPDLLDPDNYIHPFVACQKGSPTTGCEEGSSHGQGSFYYGDRLNDLIDQERREQDPQRREAIFGEIQALIAEEVPFIPLWQNREFVFAQRGITGVRLEATQQMPFWTLEKK